MMPTLALADDYFHLGDLVELISGLIFITELLVY